MDEKEKLKIDVLLKEYDSVGQAIRTFILVGPRNIAFGFTIIAAGLVYGMKEKINEVLLGLPFAVFGVMFYAIRIYLEIMTLGAYRRYLEEKISIAVGEDILLGRFLGRAGMRKPAVYVFVSFYFVCFLFVVFTIFKSLLTAWQYYPRSIVWGLGFLMFFFIVGLIISGITAIKEYDKAYQIVKKQSEQKVSIGISPNLAQKE